MAGVKNLGPGTLVRSGEAIHPIYHGYTPATVLHSITGTSELITLGGECVTIFCMYVCVSLEAKNTSLVFIRPAVRTLTDCSKLP